MGNTAKSARDAVLTGGPALLIERVLEHYGIDAMTASVAAIFLAGVGARSWRLLRTRYPVLGQILGDEGAPA